MVSLAFTSQKCKQQEITVSPKKVLIDYPYLSVISIHVESQGRHYKCKVYFFGAWSIASSCSWLLQKGADSEPTSLSPAIVTNVVSWQIADSLSGSEVKHFHEVSKYHATKISQSDSICPQPCAEHSSSSGFQPREDWTRSCPTMDVSDTANTYLDRPLPCASSLPVHVALPHASQSA